MKKTFIAFMLLAGCCEHEPEPQVLEALARVRYVGELMCSGIAIGPNEVATAYHCLAPGVRLLVDGLPAEIIECRVEQRYHPVVIADGLCRLRTQKRYQRWYPLCDSWPEGAPGTVAHQAGELTAVCLQEEGITTCNHELRHGSSGAGVVAGGCTAGVLGMIDRPNVGTDTAFWYR